MRSFFQRALMAGLVVNAAASPARAEQNRLDQSDPSIAIKTLPDGDPAVPATDPSSESVTAQPAGSAPAVRLRPASAVIVEGADDIPAAAYADTIAPILGRPLSRQDLAAFASAIGKVVRLRGYPFATATIAAQPMTDGILRVTVDRGRIDAVRVVGASNSRADAILVRALVTHRPVRQADLERALLLAADIPGVRVTGSRFVQQDGFGILLVTIEQDRVSAYAQVDNRGTSEVGPLRATLLGNIRGLADDGDELGLILAQTPVDLGDFTFLRGRYAAPVDSAGSVLAVSGSLGWSHPGAALAPFDIRGRSADVTIGYARPLLRRRARSVWANLDLRALTTRQSLAGQPLRQDRLATVTGSLNGLATTGSGTIRGEVAARFGIPNVSDLASRSDGDGRFAALSYLVDWTVPVSPRVSVVMASTGQVASRSLLAVSEIGLGGPSFGRAYDYAERTGDYGIMGSLELRFDMGRIVPGLVDRLQAYGFGDGGTVGNLRAGGGGGTLASAGAGLRGGVGRIDAMVELAFPIGEDRFDTGNRHPRLSLRLARAF